MSYEFFISLRYLRAKRKQVFVSIITFISMAGILLGVAALIIVLAVMNGFETELRDKILGINAHIILMEYTGPMKDYARVKSDISAIPGVVASTPFIYTQAMLKNGDSVSGIVLRGLSPADARDVINLGRMMEGQTGEPLRSGAGTDADAEPPGRCPRNRPRQGTGAPHRRLPLRHGPHRLPPGYRHPHGDGAADEEVRRRGHFRVGVLRIRLDLAYISLARQPGVSRPGRSGHGP